MKAASYPLPAPHREVVPNSVLGMLLFVGAEVMFFAGLLSAFTITRAGAKPGTWPLPTEPVLPAAATALNTAALVASGLLLVWATASIGGARLRLPTRCYLHDG